MGAAVNTIQGIDDAAAEVGEDRAGELRDEGAAMSLAEVLEYVKDQD